MSCPTNPDYNIPSPSVVMPPCHPPTVSWQLFIIILYFTSHFSKFLGDFMKTPGGKSKPKSLKTLQASLVSEAKELKYNLETSTPAIKARNKKVVCKTFNKAGIVVPVDVNDVGYRPLTVTDGE